MVPGTPGPRQSAAAPAGSEGAGISPSKFARDVAESRRYGIITPESGFVEIEDKALRDAMSSLYPLAEVLPESEMFGGRPTKEVWEKVHQGKGQEATWALAGYRATGERNEEQLREQALETSKDARLRALRSAYPQAFDASGNPDPRFITDDAMLTDESVGELSLTQMRRVAAADIQSRETLEMTPEENELFALAQATFERVRTGDIGEGRASRKVGRWAEGQSFAQGINGTFGDPVVGAFDYALQEELNKPGGIFDKLGVEDRHQNLAGIISQLEKGSPVGREVLAPAIKGYLGFLQNRSTFIDQDSSIRAAETRATRDQARRTRPQGCRCWDIAPWGPKDQSSHGQTVS